MKSCLLYHEAFVLGSPQVLQVFATWPVLKATADVIRNVAGFGVNQRTFVDLKVVQRLAQIADAAIQQQKKVRDASFEAR